MCSTEATSSSPFYDLNKDCFRLIAEYLDRPSLRNLSQVCQKFRSIIHCTSTLDTRCSLAKVAVVYRDRAPDYDVVVFLHRPNHPERKRIHLTTKDEASNEPTEMSIDELPPTTSDSTTEDSFYSEKDGKLYQGALICIRSLEDIARFFLEMSTFASVEQFSLDNYYSLPQTLAWLARTLDEAFPGVPQKHGLLDMNAADLELAIRPIVEVWKPSVVMRFLFNPGLRFKLTNIPGVNGVDGERILTEAAIRLMRETDRTANIVYKRPTQEQRGRTTIVVKLSDDKSTLNFEIFPT